MSLRIKTALVIITIMAVFTIASFFSNHTFTRQKIIESIIEDLTFALAIADDLVSTKIRLLKSDADTIAERLLRIPDGEEMETVMAAQMEIYPNFIALAVHSRTDIIANYGEQIDHEFISDKNNYLQRSFDGNTVISTTYHSRLTGTFLIYIFMPMDEDMVLSAAIPGNIFSSIISKHILWASGNIFIIDDEGTFIASYRPELVTERRNFVSEHSNDPNLKSVGKFLEKMLISDYGSGTYLYTGVERICVYRRISGIDNDWRIAIVAPLNESPATTLRTRLLLSALFFMGVSIVISIFLSGLAVKPLYKIKSQNKTLEDLNRTVRNASEAKSKFLAKMSHEMRTPLNAVIGLSELIYENENLSKEAQVNLEKVINAAASLLNMVNDILDISKIEAEKFELAPVEYETASMINDTVGQSIIRRGEKPVEFILNIDENIPSRLYGDDLRVKQILNNILSNAFKYTHEGMVELTVLAEKIPAQTENEDETVWLDIIVKDTGIGIRPEHIGNLFADYVQMDINSNRKIEGTGLGLPITKMITEMMGGSIAVESKYGKGSVFTIKLPQKFVTASTIGKEVVNNLKNFQYTTGKRNIHMRLSKLKLSYARVLIVDDVITNLDVARGMLKPYNMQIDCVTSGQQAIDAIRDEKVRYSAIFMDHMMPEMDGVEAVRIIREEIGTEYAKTIPIIALTANAVLGNEEMFLENGFQAFISKPIEMSRLDAIIKQWVRDKKIEKESAARGQPFIDNRKGQERRDTDDKRRKNRRRISDKKIQGMDIQKAIKRFNDDGDSYMRALRSFTSNTRPLLKKAKKAAELHLADYAIIIHGIKGSCMAIGAEVAGEQAASLEKAARADDIEFVAANNLLFTKNLSRLMVNIDRMINKYYESNPKPKKDKPDRNLLLKLRDACEKYLIDDIDEAMSEIEKYEYESDNGLAIWLRENVNQMNLDKIKERLKENE